MTRLAGQKSLAEARYSTMQAEARGEKSAGQDSAVTAVVRKLDRRYRCVQGAWPAGSDPGTSTLIPMGLEGNMTRIYRRFVGPAGGKRGWLVSKTKWMTFPEPRLVGGEAGE